LNKEERRQKILENVYNLIDKQLILELNRREIHSLVGIKNTLVSSLKVSSSQEIMVESIKTRLFRFSFEIFELDRLRLKHIILPRLGNEFFGWDSASKEVSYESALVLFEADLEYLLSSEVLSRLSPAGASARQQVLANIDASTLHYRFGRGSKVSYWQYQRLIAATQGGWSSHLVELGVLPPKEPVYELGESGWTSNSLVENEDDLEPLDEEEDGTRSTIPDRSHSLELEFPSMLP
jgi:hypothetical protein